MKNLLYYILIFSLGVGCVSKNNQMEENYNKEATNVLQELDSILNVIDHKVICPAEGYLQYPYLIPAGFYKQMWDWDAFFMGNYFCSKGENSYLKYWALNLIRNIDEKGYCAGCATTQGPRPIFGDFCMKPYLAQGIVLASKNDGDFDWVRPYFDKIALSIEYRDKTQMDEKTGLYFWQNAMQSGADNNVALNYFTDDPRSFLACDISTLQAREYESLAIIAKSLGFSENSLKYKKQADSIKEKIIQYLWCDSDKTFYNVDRETGSFYKRISYSNFWPLVDKIIEPELGKEMIKRYLVSEDHLKSAYGFRSLSKQDPDYNNKNIIIPFSNWQGPIWPLANYIYSICLKKYGFESSIDWMACKVGNLLIKDYKTCGSFHENYNAEDGTPLAPDDTYVDKDGHFIGFISWNLCIKNVLDGVVNNKWMLLDLN